MAKLEKKREREYETSIKTTDFIGRNTYGQHTSLLPGEFRDILNYEVYQKYLKSRRGSQYLRADSSPTKISDETISNSITWDIGDTEYLLYQQYNKIFYHKINPTVANQVQVTDLNGVAANLDGGYVSHRADFFLDGDKLFVIHEDGNKIIHWDSANSRFEMRDLGIDYPFINTITTESGAIDGDYTWAIELIYAPADQTDISYSSPNRYMTTRKMAALTNMSSNKAVMTIQSAELDDNDWWTHLRLWRSLRQNDDLTNPANPVSHYGSSEQLFLVAEVTRAEMEYGSIADPVYGDDYPAGNRYVEVGKPSGVYTIKDNCNDFYLSNSVGLERIELTPMPKAKVGVSHANRIFVSDVQDTELNNGERIDDDSKNNIFYSNYAGTPYSELTSGNQFVPTTRDGQIVKKLISFEKDLIVIKESKTLRLPDGEVDFNIETVDHRIGIKETNSVQYIPGLGICAITNDYDDFAIFGYDNVWRKNFNNIPISRNIREDLKDVDQSNISFIYINGKAMVSDGTDNVFVLNVEAGRGWSRFEYKIDAIGDLFVFNGGRSAGILSKGNYLVEIEVEDVDTDVNAINDIEDQEFTLDYTTHMWQSGHGSDVLEQQWLGIMAYISNTMVGTPYVNGLPWPNITTPLGWEFVGQDGGYAQLADREYRLYIEPQTIGDFKWMPVVANYIHYKITTVAPAVIKVHSLRCIVDTDGLSFGGFDPLQTFSSPFGPPWASNSENIIETGDSADDTITETGSGSDDTITETGE